jgi:hypothetical protein
MGAIAMLGRPATQRRPARAPAAEYQRGVCTVQSNVPGQDMAQAALVEKQPCLHHRHPGVSRSAAPTPTPSMDGYRGSER